MLRFIMYCLIFILFVSSTFIRGQQNLVPNWSFENYTSCPNFGSQINLALPWTGTNNNSDYFNACNPPCLLSVPCQSSLSFQFAKTGAGFAGEWMLNGFGGNYREYIQVQLIDFLKINECYKVKFYINLQSLLSLAVNNFGVHFSPTSYTTNGGVAPYTPQVLGFKNKIINDTLNWVEISGIYQANGTEKYLTIGNFYDDAHTDTLGTGNGTYSGAYYFIDDVSVIPIDSLPGGMPAFAGNDTSVVAGDSVFIGQEISNLNCNWYNSAGVQIASNTSGIYVSPTATTYFVVAQNLCGTTTYDTVNVTVGYLGLPELEKEFDVEVFPNPTTGNFSVVPIDPSITELYIELFDVAGKRIYQNTVQRENTLFNINLELSDGLYNLQINKTVTKRIVVQN